MHIVDFCISNYKSFRFGPHTPLAPGFNVIVGPNNVGKTAMIEALSLRFGNAPHRSLASAPHVTTPLLAPSKVNFLLGMGADEFREIVTTFSPLVHLPVEELTDANVEAAVERFLHALEAASSIELSAEWENGGLTEAQVIGVGTRASIRRLNAAVGVAFDTDNNRPYPAEGWRRGEVNAVETLPLRLAAVVRDRIYAFRAERFNVGEADFGHDSVLESNASNLARVLNRLQSNPERYRRFNALVTTILPDVTQVTVQPTDNGKLRILVWTIDPATEREDLAVPLSESGTGVGQVLSMLYVVMTSEYPRIILIDEPQSFLHPGAARKLFEVLRTEARHDHQYIIATHAPGAVTAADPSTLLLVRKEAGESTVEVADIGEARSTRLFLAEVGARLSDVFGADDIFWVEGPTEERCFPLILRRLTKAPLLGTEIIGLRSTGELEGRQARAAFEIYERLSSGRGLLPPAVAFVFDREGRSERDRGDLERQSRGKVHFLRRRMYENYLLKPAAIAAVASSIEGFVQGGGRPLTTAVVADWIERNRWQPRYVGSEIPEGERTPERWLADVHGAKLLADLFDELSDARVPYEKVAYGVALTEWLLEHSPVDLKELADILSTIMISSRLAASSDAWPRQRSGSIVLV